MKATELISDLKAARAQHGDLEVMASTNVRVIGMRRVERISGPQLELEIEMVVEPADDPRASLGYAGDQDSD